MYWYEDEVKRILRRRDAYRGESPLIFYGSSSIRLWDTLAEDMVPWPVLNLGFGGSTIAACCWFFERVFTPLSPRALVFYAGENDLGDGRNSEELINHFRLFLTDWKQSYPGVPLFYISLKHSPKMAHLEIATRFANDEIRKLCEKEDEVHFIDIQEGMKGEKLQNAQLFTADGLHMNAKGYAIWTREVRQSLKRVLPQNEAVLK